jgi:hypothetical protein
VVRLDNHPPEDDLVARANYIGEHICARFTDCRNGDDEEEKDIHDKYQSLIRQNMLHRCSEGANGCKNKQGICSRGYMTRECTPINSFGDDGKYSNLVRVKHTKIYLY